MKAQANPETSKSILITTEETYHNNEHRVKLIFRYDVATTQAVKKLKGSRWSETMQCWHIPYTSGYLSDIESVFNTNVNIQPVNNVLHDRHNEIQKIIISIKISRNEGLIYLKMPYIPEFIPQIKSLDGAWWHPGAKLWSVFYSLENLEFIKKLFNKNDYIIQIKDSDNEDFNKKEFKSRAPRNNLPKDYIVQLKLENKSTRTIEVYTGFVAQFLNDFKGKDIERLGDDEIREYVLEHREQRGYSESYQNQLVSSIRSYYKSQYNREFEPGVLPRPKRSMYLPKVLPREDIQKMIDICKNEKHRMILLMLYGFGLRLSELIKLQMRDIDFDRRHLAVIKGKGKKDRILPIPLVMIPTFKKYIKSYLPKNFFITGQYGEQYSASSIQTIIRRTARQAGIEQRVTPHMIRHCYATHMLERGTDLRYIQNLLGHKSSKTTEIYTHVSMRKLIDLNNPLDDIQF